MLADEFGLLLCEGLFAKSAATAWKSSGVVSANKRWGTLCRDLNPTLSALQLPLARDTLIQCLFVLPFFVKRVLEQAINLDVLDLVQHGSAIAPRTVLLGLLGLATKANDELVEALDQSCVRADDGTMYGTTTDKGPLPLISRPCGRITDRLGT